MATSTTRRSGRGSVECRKISTWRGASSTHSFGVLRASTPSVGAVATATPEQCPKEDVEVDVKDCIYAHVKLKRGPTKELVPHRGLGRLRRNSSCRVCGAPVVGMGLGVAAILQRDGVKPIKSWWRSARASVDIKRSQLDAHASRGFSKTTKDRRTIAARNVSWQSGCRGRSDTLRRKRNLRAGVPAVPERPPLEGTPRRGKASRHGQGESRCGCRGGAKRKQTKTRR